MNKIVLFIISCLLLSQSVYSGKNELYSLIPPIPKNKPDFVSEIKRPHVTGFKHMGVLLEIKKNGEVSSVVPESTSDTLHTKFVAAYLKSFQFSPAIRNSKEIDAKLPVLVHFTGRMTTPDIEFPITETTSSLKLLEKFYKVNNVHLPGILTFPTYNADINPTDSMLYRFQLYKLQIDNSGKLTSIDKILSTYPSFDMQIESAMLYASFSSLKEKKKSKSSECLIKVSYFPNIHYPTYLFDASYIDTLSQLKKRRVEILPVGTRFLSEPLPKTINDHQFPISNIKYAFHTSFEVYVHIDTLGFVSIMRYDGKIKNEIESARKICDKLRMYPALDMEGNPVDYYGYIRFERFEQTNIRISYLWLQ